MDWWCSCSRDKWGTPVSCGWSCPLSSLGLFTQMPIPTSLKLLLTEAWAWCTAWYDWQSPLCGQIMAQGRLPITHARVDQVFHLSRLPSQYSNLLSWISSASFGLPSSFWHSSGPFRHLAIIPDPGWSSYLIIEYYLWSCVSGWYQY